MGAGGDEWKRSWWIVFTLVPFGWLGFAAFAYAGRKARRRDWTGWAVVYFLVFWTATVVASVEELDYGVRQAGGLVLFFGTPVPFVHALLVRRQYLTATGSAPPPAIPPAGAVATPPGKETAPEDPAPQTLVRGPAPRVEGWARARFSGPFGVVALSLFGLGAVGAGSDLVERGDPSGISLIAAGLAMLVMLPLFAPGRRLGRPVTRPVSDTGDAGLVFELSLVRLQGSTAAVGLLAAAAAGLALWPESFSTSGSGVFTRVIGAAATLALGGGFAANLRSFRGGFVALTPRGVVKSHGGRGSFVPWDAIAAIRATEMSIRWPVREPLIGVFVTDRRLVEGGSRVGRRLGRLRRRRLQGDVTYPARLFETEPAWVLATLRHYLEHPDERAHLGSPESLMTFERLAAGAG